MAKNILKKAHGNKTLERETDELRRTPASAKQDVADAPALQYSIQVMRFIMSISKRLDSTHCFHMHHGIHVPHTAI